MFPGIWKERSSASFTFPGPFFLGSRLQAARRERFSGSPAQDGKALPGEK